MMKTGMTNRRNRTIAENGAFRERALQHTGQQYFVGRNPRLRRKHCDIRRVRRTRPTELNIAAQNAPDKTI